MVKVVLWLDDVREPASTIAEPGTACIWCKSVTQAIETYTALIFSNNFCIIGFDLDHDAGDYVKYGGDYIRFIDWLEFNQIDFTSYKWRIHSMNPVGIRNMFNIIEKHGGKVSL